MRTIVLMCFWLMLVGAVLRLLCLAFVDYPRNVEVTRLGDVLAILFGAALAAWCAAVLWGAA